MLYTRWEYNDRGQIFPQALFQMNPDGTGQTEFYGNNSWFPTTILHARGIPGTQQGRRHLSRATTRARRASWGSSIRPGAGRRTRACS